MADVKFHQYWQSVLNDVEDLQSGRSVVTDLPMRTNELSNAFGVQLRSSEGVELFGYYCVPKGKGPFPGLLMTPGYGSVVPVPPLGRRRKFAVLSLCTRGQRLSDGQYRAAYPGLLTDGIEQATSYPFRGVVADCLRGFDFLASRSEIDSARIAVASGNNLGDLAVIAASLRPEAKAVLVNSPMMFRDTMSRLDRVEDYPMEEFKDFLRGHPNARSSVAGTLALFDPVQFAPKVQAQVAFSGSRSDLEHMQPVIGALGGAGHTIFEKSGKGHLDHECEESWLSQAVD